MHNRAIAENDLIGLVFAAKVVVLESVVLEEIVFFLNRVVPRGGGHDDGRDQAHQDHEGEQHPLEALLFAPNDLRRLVSDQGEDEQGEHEHAEEDVEPHKGRGGTKGPPCVLDRFAIEVIILEQIRVGSAAPAIHIVVNANGPDEELRLEIIYERAEDTVVSELELSTPQLPQVVWSTVAIVVAYHPGQVFRVVGERGAHEAKVHDGGSGQEARSHHAEVRHCGLEELSETRLGRVEHASVRRRRLCFCGCSRQNARTSEALENLA
mmetsp:Transcript_14685/g.55576  ORF Transcript_14685/g.55576 Transcript_14685/m.55576 type:complete len:266 (-) Transcript_14685:349-1146(-)